MFCFYQKSDKVFNVPVSIMQGMGFNILSVPSAREHPTMKEVYITTQEDAFKYNEFVKRNYPDGVEIFSVNNSVFDTIKMPFMIGDNSGVGYRNDIELIEAIEAIYKDQKRKITIAIFSGADKSLGELMCLISVVKKINETLKDKNIDAEIIFLKTTDSIRSGFTTQFIFPELKQKMLPICLEEMQAFDFLLEISKQIETVNDDYHDIYAKMFNFELPKDFNPEGDFCTREHQKILATKKIDEIFDKKLPVLSINSNSSKVLRTMPNKIKEELINKILDTGKFNIVSFDPLNNVLDIKHPNYAILSTYTINFEDYASFLSATDGLISVDSAPIHLAARLDVPSFGIYTAAEPKSREKYYKKADAIFVDNEYKDRKNDLTEDELNEVWDKLDVDLIVKKITKKFKKGLF